MDVREKLVEVLSKYFNIGDSYAYNLTKVKSAFACGTVGLDDFEEFDDETVEDIASYLIDNGVTVRENAEISDELLKQLKNAPITICKEEPSIELVQEWISVNDRLPDEHESLFARYKGTDKWRNAMFTTISDCVIVCAEYENGKRIVKTANTVDGVWKVKDILCPCKVTHWMPLPKPPKGE